jgi:glycine cleavage system H protein
MEIKDDLLYTKEHEWVKIENNQATIGITDYAQSSLGDITFVELPQKKETVKQFKVFSVVESVKAASDVYAPLSGVIIEVNEALSESPQAINESPYDKGWFVKIKIGNINEKENLLTASDYRKYLDTLE